jgi:hypothetical protein
VKQPPDRSPKPAEKPASDAKEARAEAAVIANYLLSVRA